ncbi:hypothetical protein LCGC14_0194960 [marine sediment metagenome]|uniref:Uncharacterized protein n=1 Tax=marine sediment metagenome TaxID=412755 RepID=A0A0F9UPU4_9ZZZZ
MPIVDINDIIGDDGEDTISIVLVRTFEYEGLSRVPSKINYFINNKPVTKKEFNEMNDDMNDLAGVPSNDSYK